MKRYAVMGETKEGAHNVFKDDRTFAHYSSALRARYRMQLGIAEELYIKEVNAIDDTERLEWMIKNILTVKCVSGPMSVINFVFDKRQNPREAIDDVIRKSKL